MRTISNGEHTLEIVPLPFQPALLLHFRIGLVAECWKDIDVLDL